MRRNNLAGLALTAIVTAMIFAGCSGGSQVGSAVSPMSANVPQQQSVFRAIQGPRTADDELDGPAATRERRSHTSLTSSRTA